MRLAVLTAALLALAACERPAPATTAQAAEAAPAAAPSHVFQPAITAADFAEHLRTLSSDAFEGRAPGGEGERRTVAYLEQQFRRMGLKPGNGDSYVQTVKMVKSTADAGSWLRFEAGGTSLSPKFADEMVISTASEQPVVRLDGSEVVFVGYGVRAPEQQWDDYAGLDMKGKTAIVLVNDPGFARKDPGLFRGRAMTYYGRWTYKYEECARQGAAACLLVHDTEAAAYGWEVVRNSWTGAQFDLPVAEVAEPRVPVKGWISGEVARKLFAAAGQDFEALRLRADQRGFSAVPLKARASVELQSTIEQGSSANVLALLPGKEHADEAVVFSAHWDHLDMRTDETGQQRIYNGAIDNATGVAAALEIAGALASGVTPPQRSVLFMIPTLEESGLLGSQWYASHPVFPPAMTVAAINMDALPVGPRARDMTVIGYGQSELDVLLAQVLATQDRVPTPELEPEKGSYFRSDHFSFARIGVPALNARGGYDLREGGVGAGLERSRAYTAARYHNSTDTFDPAWNYDGVIEDVQALYEVGQRLAAGTARPQWSADSEFRALREAAPVAAGAVGEARPAG